MRKDDPDARPRFIIAGFHQTFSDFTFVTEAVVEAVVRSTLSGIQAGPIAGLPYKGRPFSTMALDIHQSEDGLIARSRHVEDWLGALVQMELELLDRLPSGATWLAIALASRAFLSSARRTSTSSLPAHPAL